MADREIIYRRSMTRALWLAGIAFIIAVLWLLVARLPAHEDDQGVDGSGREGSPQAALHDQRNRVGEGSGSPVRGRSAPALPRRG